jgi:hypothetical protein
MATAHGTLLLLILTASAFLAFVWPADSSVPVAARSLEMPALCLQTAALLYLASTALIEWSLVKTRHRGQDARSLLGLPTLLGHLWVLLVSLAAAWRGVASRTYLAGLELQLAVLIAASLMSLCLVGMARWHADRNRKRSDLAAAQDSYLRWGGWCHAGISLLVVFALWYLETRRLGG